MERKALFLSTLISLVAIDISPIEAQIVPRLNTPPIQPPEEIQPLPSLEELLPSQPQNPNSSGWKDIPGEITVSQFKVVGSSIFTPEQFAEVLQPYIDTPISFAQLIEAQNLITQLYQDRGYITSGAFVPVQTIVDGIVTIQVVEGSIESIDIEGLDRLQADYIRSRISIASGAPLNQQKLLAALQLLQVNPLIDTISAELSAGNQLGTSILNIKVTEARAFQTTISYDNYRNPSVGTNRILGQISHDNLTGWGDRLNISYYSTDGSDSLDDLSYTVPINAYNGTITGRFRSSDSKVIEPSIFEQFDLESEYRKYEFTYRQPVIQSANQELALGVTADWQTTSNFLLGEPFPLSRGADNQGKTRIFTVRFFQEYNNRSQKDVFLARSQFNFGLNAFGATENSGDQPDSEFFAWRGQIQYLNLLTPDVILLLRSDLQLANKSLLPVEQFSIGGIYTVRGYPQDALLADNGFFASAELRTNIAKIPDWDTTIQLSPFVDFGTVWNNDNFPLQADSLASVGVGLRVFVNDRFTARLDWGIPLNDFENSIDTLQSDGLYFSVEFQPFK